MEGKVLYGGASEKATSPLELVDLQPADDYWLQAAFDPTYNCLAPAMTLARSPRRVKILSTAKTATEPIEGRGPGFQCRIALNSPTGFQCVSYL